MNRYTVDPGLAGDRLDSVLSGLLDESRSRSVTRIANGEVQVNGLAQAKSYRVEAGDLLVVAAPPEVASGAAGVAPPPIRFEDEHLLIVAKPPGMVVHPGVGNPAGTLVQAVIAAGHDLVGGDDPERPGIVHRLDKDTSGLLMLAKTEAAYAGLIGLLQARTVERRYVAIVEGALGAERGTVDGPIGRDPRERKRFAVVEDGKHAITHFAVLARGRTAPDRAVTLLECRLETGRTHQIRVHLAYAKHPVAGDAVYGASRVVTADLGLSRPFLHAVTLGFEHPVTGAQVRVQEPLPDDLLAAAEAAGPEVSEAARSAAAGGT